MAEKNSATAADPNAVYENSTSTTIQTESDSEAGNGLKYYYV